MSIFEDLAITEEAVGAPFFSLKSLFLSMQKQNDIKMLLKLTLVDSMVHDTYQSMIDDTHPQ
jgi:hypothetical protein